MTAPYRRANYGKIIQKYALTVSLSLLTPIVIISIGVIIFSVGDRRVSAIDAYNERVVQWKSFESEFMNTTFYVDNEEMSLRVLPQKSYFPVADACNKVGDPSNGCMYSESIYYSLNYTSSSAFLNFTITDSENRAILSDMVAMEDVIRHSQRTLNCADTASCTKACSALSGIWDVYKNECTIKRHLNTICYRLSFANNQYVLDPSAAGCFFSNLCSPYMYVNADTERVVTIDLRYHLDPVVVASDETRGCSDDKLYLEEDSNCFGSTKTEQAKAGKQMLIIGCVLLGIEVIMFLVLLIVYVYHNRRVNTKVQMSESMELLFTPYSVEELFVMHSPHLEEIREWTASKKSLLSA